MKSTIKDRNINDKMRSSNETMAKHRSQILRLLRSFGIIRNPSQATKLGHDKLQDITTL